MTQREEFEKWYEEEYVKPKPFTTASIKDEMFEAWKARKATSATPDGWKLVPVDLIERFPEINPNNYGDAEVKAINDWGIEVITTEYPVPS